MDRIDLRLGRGIEVLSECSDTGVCHIHAAAYSLCTTVQQRVPIPECNVGPKTGSCAEDTKHMADCGKNTQGTRDTTNHVSVRCCRQTGPFRDKILQTDFP